MSFFDVFKEKRSFYSPSFYKLILFFLLLIWSEISVHESQFFLLNYIKTSHIFSLPQLSGSGLVPLTSFLFTFSPLI